jgi:hypothetical protein
MPSQVLSCVLQAYVFLASWQADRHSHCLCDTVRHHAPVDEHNGFASNDCFVLLEPPSQARPEFLTGWQAELWTRFFCLAVYSTMYLNDHSPAHADLYGLLGMNPTTYSR